MSASYGSAAVVADDPIRMEAIAVGGFLAGYCGSTRRSYATDLRLFSAWCQDMRRVALTGADPWIPGVVRH